MSVRVFITAVPITKLFARLRDGGVCVYYCRSMECVVCGTLWARILVRNYWFAWFLDRQKPCKPIKKHRGIISPCFFTFHWNVKKCVFNMPGLGWFRMKKQISAFTMRVFYLCTQLLVCMVSTDIRTKRTTKTLEPSNSFQKREFSFGPGCNVSFGVRRKLCEPISQ